MNKTTYNRAQVKIAQVSTGIDTSKSYRQVALRQLCKYMKTPADAWRGLPEAQLSTMSSLASNIVAYGQLTPKQWGLAKRILNTHRR